MKRSMKYIVSWVELVVVFVCNKNLYFFDLIIMLLLCLFDVILKVFDY